MPSHGVTFHIVIRGVVVQPANIPRFLLVKVTTEEKLFVIEKDDGCFDL